MMRLVKSLLLAGFLAFSNVSYLHAEEQNDWHVLRSLGFTLTINLLTYYSSFADVRDPRQADAYKMAQGELQSIASRRQHTELSKLLDQLNLELSRVEQLPADQHQLLPLVLDPVVETQAAIDRLAEGQLSESSSTLVNTLRETSINCSRITLLYQLQLYRFMVKPHFIDYHEGIVQELDQRIIEQFSELDDSLPESRALRNPKRNYQFVRSRFTDYGQRYSPGGVTTYMGMAVKELDDLANQHGK